jgi:signal transduction histidine kinase
MSTTPATKLTRAQVGDLALAAVLVIVGVLGTAGASAGATPDRPIDLAGYLVVGVGGGVVVGRRRWPVVTLVVVAGLTAGYLAVGYAFGPILLSFFVAVYTAARHRPLGRAGPWALVALAFLSVHAFTNSAALPGLSGALLASGWVVVPFAIGATRRVTREAVERERAEMIRQRVDLERLRVAHEVHDIVGHGLAAIRMQAEVALHVLPKRPEQAREALEAISRTSGEALDELRTTLGSVRDPTAELERSEPRLERLGDLQQRMTDAGVRVQVEVAGDPRPLPPAVDLAGYRVVQESLTNVLRHSRAHAADVRIDYQADAVVIVVSNPAPDALPLRGDGLGIAGMRRRVTLLGGEFTAGPTPEHRFEVRAHIPTKGLP